MLEKYLNHYAGIYHEEPNDKGGGGGDPEPKKIVVTGEDILPKEILDKFKSMAEKSGDVENFAQTLYNENYKLREKLRESDSKGLQDGQVAVPKEVAEHYEWVKEQGGIEKVKERMNKYEELQTNNQKLSRQITARKIADNYDYNPAVLSDLTRDENVEIREIETEDDKGEKITAERAFIVREGKEDMELSKWIDSEKSMYLPALQKEGGNGENSRRRFTSQNPKERGGKAPASSAVDRIKKRNQEQAKADNPLTAK